MHKNLLFFFSFLFALWLPNAYSNSVPKNQLNAIGNMGQLNAIALQCSYVKQMQNIKRVLIKVLPQKRELGEWFEHTTNETYMDFLSKKSSCPSNEQFKTQLKQAIQTLPRS